MSRRRHETCWEQEAREMREAFERRDDRRNEPMTRGDILDAIDACRLECGGNCNDHDYADMRVLDALRRAFE